MLINIYNFLQCSELATESIPGCVLQIYVWLLNPKQAGNGALASIAISVLTTGYASAMIAYDFDVDVPHRKNQPNFYGFIPDDHNLRGRCFTLMLFISSLTNLSRSVGCALMFASLAGKSTVIYFMVGEMLVFFVFKLLRKDFFYWPRIGGVYAFAVSFLSRFVVKTIVDFSGCLHFRHPYEMGGIAFSSMMVWAQAMPFVALTLPLAPEIEERKESIRLFLLVAFGGWLLMNVTFFFTIDLSYLHTFFGLQTAPQYTIELFMTSKLDSAKFRAAFKKRKEYTDSIHDEIKIWVKENIERWRLQKEDWFNLD